MSVTDDILGVPNRKMGSYMDPELHGTGLQERGLAHPALVKKVSWNPAEIGKT